jgi:plasmid stabilization system protein ParE
VSAARVDYHPQAVRELEEAFDWYLERSLHAADSFLREAERAVAVIAGAPTIWPRFEAGARRYLLRRFPYGILYRQTRSGIEVIAVAHLKRRPGYWRHRLSG